MRGTLLVMITAATALTFAVAGNVSAAPTAQAPTQCLELTTRSDLDGSAIAKGLGLTAEQVRALRSRLTQYWRPAGFPGLGGLGLTQQQIALIQARINADVTAMQKHPLGWPCKAFTHRARTVAFIRKLLIGNGYESASIRFYGTAPRQIQFNGIKNGIELIGAVARSGTREITILLTSSSPVGGTYVFSTPFDV